MAGRRPPKRPTRSRSSPASRPRSGFLEPWYRDYPPPSRPLPADGIRAKSRRGAIGETWWSKRFIAVLERFHEGPRLARGRTYARAGQVLDLEVAPGEVTAQVQGSRPRPYEVRIVVKTLSDADWRRAEEAMAGQALFLARLLAGEMPLEIEEAFAACRLSLFPSSARDLSTDCTCPDWGNPCKHVAAAYYLLAESFDADPFLIFAWRGRPKDQLLEDLRALRDEHGNASETAETVQAFEGSLIAYPEDPPLVDCLDRYWDAAPELDELRLDPRATDTPAALLSALDPLPITVRGHPIAELITPAYPLITAAAERRALGPVVTYSAGVKVRPPQ